jgi:hypothetical protein
MYESSWAAAEQLLRDSKTWIFVGYSLPAADYEFKHLLKRVQLSRRHLPHIVVITGGDAAGFTRSNYQKFFGPQLRHSNGTYFGPGLDAPATRALRDLGALHSR